MGFTNIFGLIGLMAIPIIIILYMLKPKNKPFVIPSLYLWKQMSEEIESAARLKKLKASLLMFLQIFIVLLMTLILAGLFMRNTSNASKVLIIIECSYTMASEDVQGNRLEYAKTLIADYIKELPEASEVSILALEGAPRTIMIGESNKGYVFNAISQLEVVDGICDIELVAQTIELLQIEGQEVIYFGDRTIGGINQVLTMKNTKNYSVHNITYTKYVEEGSITALTEIYNHDNKKALIPISLYVDDVFFSAKQVEIEGKTSGKVFFEGISIKGTSLHIQIDGKDILAIDNNAYTPINSEKKQKALLLSKSNKFLEKALLLHPNIELYVAEDSLAGLYGYDLYIFDAMLPKEYPVDGNYLIFDPEGNFKTQDDKSIEHLGYVNNPVFTTNNHLITSLIEKSEFSAQSSSVYDIQNPRSIIYNTTFGAGAFETTIEGNKAVVFGFDIHETDLPLSVEFPILIMNGVDYLLTNRMVESGNYYAGDGIEISVFPSTIKGSVTMPDGVVRNMDVSRGTWVFSDTSQVGTYRVTQENRDETLEESFSINVPIIMEANKDVKDAEGKELPISSETLGKILGVLLVLFLSLEWIIYSYRRKINVAIYK